MAINTSEIGNIYDTLMDKAKTTIDTYVNDLSLSQSDRANVLSNVITTAMQVSASSVIEQSLTDAQIAKLNAETSFVGKQELEVIAETTRKDNESTAKINFMNEQKNSEIMRNKVGGLIDTQISVAAADALLKGRQKTAFDDQKKIEKAKFYSQYASMFGLSSSLSAPSGLTDEVKNALNAITS